MLSSRIFRFSHSLLGFHTVRQLHKARAVCFPLVQFKLSDIGEGIAEVQVKEWHVKVGDTVSQFDNLCEVQSDKASVTITSRYDGVIKNLLYKVDDIARVGQPLVEIEVAGEVENESNSNEQTSQSAVNKPHSSDTSSLNNNSTTEHKQGKVLATPAVRRIAMENQIDLVNVIATGKDGRVLKEDVLKFLGQVRTDHSFGSSNVRASPPSGNLPQSSKTLSSVGEDRVVPIRGYTRAMIKTMTEALKIPHFGYDDEVNVSTLIQIRSELKEFAAERGVKLSYMPFFIKAASLALLEFPSLNAIVDDNVENVIHKASHNISLAMDTSGGLVVPNIKHCEQRSIFEIASELQRIHENAKKQQIAREDLIEGTFTLSNIGAIGGTYANPVIFPPQVAIGAIGKMERLPRFDKHDNVVAVNLVKVSWAADHRVVDGATMARFSNRWKFYLEHPFAMLAHLK